MTTELIERQTVKTLVKNYELALSELRQGLAMLSSAYSRVGDLWKRDLRGGDLNSSDTITDCEIHIRRQQWRKIIKQLDIDKIMSIEAKNKLDKQLCDYNSEDNLPELTVENVFEVLQGFIGNSDKYFQEAIKEVFDWLRPGRWDTHKTNKKFYVGEKVIINGGINVDQWFMRINYYDEPRLTALDNVFHLLDGQGCTKYPFDFKTVLAAACTEKKFDCQTEYFLCKWYLNGNLHITFRRLDLLKKLNQSAGGDALPDKEHERPAKKQDAADKALAAMGL